MNDKVLSLLGLCKKAGKLVYGTDATIDKLSHNKLYYMFIASDASEGTIDKLEKKAYFYKVDVNKSFTTTELNNSIGAKNTKVIGILDSGFAKTIIKYLQSEEERENN
jgi:ribosomal protein L7Ae-like RNA K-turn-binding protein